MIHVLTFVLGPVTAFVIAYHLIPVIIKLALERSLVDMPDGRKHHKAPTPALGGVAIFIGMIASFFLWADFSQVAELQYTFLSMILLFFVGLKDDLSEINANHKFLIQVGLAFLIALGGLRITTLHGLLGIGVLPPIFQYIVTIVFIVGLTNAYNMIDGIDGLAGGIALIASMVLGIVLFLMEDYVYGVLAFSLAGSLVGFLAYNFSPAKIFMGDTGSLSIGVLLVVLCIRFLESSEVLAGFTSFNSFAPVLVFSVLVVPLIDVVQVIITRKMESKPVFSPDRNHLHHVLLRTGLTHQQAAITLFGITLSCVMITFAGFWAGISMSVMFSLLIVLLMSGVVILRRKVARHLRKAIPSKPAMNASMPVGTMIKAG